jgi:hypothetical protein
VEEKDLNLEPDEEKDVEGHVQYANLDREEKENLRQEDEGDDVEGHVHHGVNQAVNQRQDEGDDVEGHVNY